MRRALTFLLIFTYQIMSVVFYLIFPRSTFYGIARISRYALFVDVGMIKRKLFGAEERLPELWLGFVRGFAVGASID